MDRGGEPGGGGHHGDPVADPGLPLDMCDGRHERLDRKAELDTGLHDGGLHTGNVCPT